MYQQLCISGGGIKGFQILGTLCYIHNNVYDLSKITNFVGTSVGSILCYLLCIGYTPLEIMTKVFNDENLNKFSKIPDILKFTKEGGCFSFSSIADTLENITLDKIDKFHTLYSLYNELGKKLTIVTYNFSKKQSEFLTYENNPDLPCLTGLQMSSTIPIVFPPLYYQDNIYIDGGLVYNLPIDIIDKELNTITISTNPSENIDNNEEFNLFSYILDILLITNTELQKFHIEKSKEIKNNKLIILSCYEGAFFDFSISKSKKIDLFLLGYMDTIKDFK